MVRKNAILVTGASGFLGSRLVKQLIARGEAVKGFVRAGSNLNLLHGLPEGQFELAYGDVLVGDTVFRALASCNRLIHVAGNFSMWSQNPEHIMATAVHGTKNVLTAAKQRDIERIVITSSVGVLGVTDGPTTLDETHAFNVEDPETYYLSKLRADEIVQEASALGVPRPTGDYCSTTFGAAPIFGSRYSTAVSTSLTWMTSRWGMCRRSNAASPGNAIFCAETT